MHRMRDILRNGDWLTSERIRLVAIAILIASAAGLLYLIVTANGLNDQQGRPLGTDFSSFYAAGTYALDGRPEAPFSPANQYAREQEIFGGATPFYSYFYPPFFLLIAAVLALMPYGLALAVWQAASLGLYLIAIRAILGSSSRGAPSANTAPAKNTRSAGMPASWLPVALAFPAVLVNVGHGQNGLLTAALFGGGLAILDRRPLVAGALLGLLVYKPQLGLMIPIALAAGGRWRSFAAAAATVALLAAATMFLLGPQVWLAFFHSTGFARLALEQGAMGWSKLQSVFAWARMWSVPVLMAYALQATVTVAVGGALARLWRSAAPYALKAAALCLAALLATPFVLDYDMMLLAPAIAFLAVDGLIRGFGPWEKTTLAVVWLAPLAARSVAQATLIPLGVLAMLAMFVVILRRAELDPALPMAFAGTPSTIADASAARGHDIAAFE